MYTIFLLWEYISAYQVFFLESILNEELDKWTQVYSSQGSASEHGLKQQTLDAT